MGWPVAGRSTAIPVCRAVIPRSSRGSSTGTGAAGAATAPAWPPRRARAWPARATRSRSWPPGGGRRDPDMSVLLASLFVRHEQDVVAVRQRAREIAARLGFDGQGQTRIATAVSEIARNAFMYAGGGK